MGGGQGDGGEVNEELVVGGEGQMEKVKVQECITLLGLCNMAKMFYVFFLKPRSQFLFIYLFLFQCKL